MLFIAPIAAQEWTVNDMTIEEAIKHCLEVADAQEEVIKSRKICEVLAEQFDSPCNFSPIDEYMLKNGCCEDCCDGDIPNVECWSRYLQTKIVGGSGNGGLDGY